MSSFERHKKVRRGLMSNWHRMAFCKQWWQRTRTCTLRCMEGTATWESVSGPFGPCWYLIHSGFSVEDCPMECMNEWGSRIQKDVSSNTSHQDSIFQRMGHSETADCVGKSWWRCKFGAVLVFSWELLWFGSRFPTSIMLYAFPWWDEHPLRKKARMSGIGHICVS